MSSMYRPSTTQALPQGPFSPGPQVVIPQITIPNGVQRWEPLTCKGRDAAYKIYTPPGVRVPIFDEDEQVFYYKETDQYGNVIAFETYSYSKVEEPAPPEYVTTADFKWFVDEFNKFKEELLNGKSFRSQGHDRSYNNSARNAQSAGASDSK